MAIQLQPASLDAGQNNQLPDIWRQVSANLSAQMTEQDFRSWVARLYVAGGDDEQVKLAVANAFTRDWIAENLLEKIESCWQQVDPHARSVLLQIAGNKQSTKNTNAGQMQSKSTVNAATSGDRPENASSEVPADGWLKPAIHPGKFRFDNFVVGPSNEVPWAVAKQVARGEQHRFNPLFIHGGYGLGKTHLLRAIATMAAEETPGRSVLYLTAEEFVQKFVGAVRGPGTHEFKQHLRSVDLLLVDDMHFLAGKAATQDEFVHTLYALIERGANVVLSADRAPGKIAALDERLRSRLGGGLVCTIAPAALDLRREILLARIEEMQEDFADLHISQPIVDFMAARITNSPRELLGALNMVLSASALVGKQVTMQLVEDVLSDLLRASTVRVTIADIQKAVASWFQLRREDLLSRRKTRNIVRPRQIAMYLSKELTSASLPMIGQRFDGRDHTTVIHAVRTISRLIGEDPGMANEVEGLRRALTKVQSETN